MANIFKHWQTSLFGGGASLGIILAQASYYFDANPDTVVDWNVLVPAVVALVSSLAAKDPGK